MYWAAEVRGKHAKHAISDLNRGLSYLPIQSIGKRQIPGYLANVQK